MSRAVLSWRRLGRPEALRNWVRFMPSALAFRVIMRANLVSFPPSASATTTAASFADLVISARIAFSTVIVSPRFSPSLAAGMPAARRETLSFLSRVMSPRSKASKAR